MFQRDGVTCKKTLAQGQKLCTHQPNDICAEICNDKKLWYRQWNWFAKMVSKVDKYRPLPHPQDIAFCEPSVFVFLVVLGCVALGRSEQISNTGVNTPHSGLRTDTDNSGLKSMIQNSCLAIFLVCLFEARAAGQSYIYESPPLSPGLQLFNQFSIRWSCIEFSNNFHGHIEKLLYLGIEDKFGKLPSNEGGTKSNY